MKKTNFKIKNPKFDYEVNNLTGNKVSNKQAYDMIEKAKCLLAEKPDKVKKSDLALITKDKQFNVPDLSNEA